MLFKSVNTKKKVLFFISGPVPTAAQMAQADTITTNSRVVAFRNATQVGKDDGLERADFVCGDVPARYLVEAKGWVVPQLIDFKQPELAFGTEPEPSTPMAPVTTSEPVAVAPEAPAPVVAPASAPAPEPAPKPTKAKKK